MLLARLSAVAFLLMAGMWIGSGYLKPATAPTPPERSAEAARPLFRVVVAPVSVEPRARRLTLTGRTQSDQRVIVSARTSGNVLKLFVRRGALVKAGDPIAELSDEAREAGVAQARSRLAQRAAELEAREVLAKRGNYPTLNLEQLRAEKQAAETALALAEAELSRTNIVAPIDGIVNDLSVEIGQGLMMGGAIAEIIAPDPLLAVVEVPERRLGGLKLGEPAEIRLVTGQVRTGRISFIARRPAGQTRTYRVDVSFANTDGAIADGIAAEVALRLAPVPATRIARSALTFSAEGELGVRFIDEGNVVGFAAVSLVDDEDSHIWVSGLRDGLRVITRGQEFIREGQKVEPVTEPSAEARPAPARP